MSSAQRTAREQAIYDSLVYPGTDVLRNKHGIIDQVALDKIEVACGLLTPFSRTGSMKKFGDKSEPAKCFYCPHQVQRPPPPDGREKSGHA